TLPPDRRAQVEGRASQARMSLSRTGWEVVVLPPSRRLRDVCHVERHPPPGPGRGPRLTSPDVPVPGRVGGRRAPTVEEIARRMARRADPTPGHQRLLGLAAVTALCVGAARAVRRG